MKLGRVKKIFTFILSLALVVVVVMAFLILTMDKPPMTEIANCRTALSKAKSKNADIYAPELYRKAEADYKAAMIEWERQNEKVFFKRDFDKVKEIILSTTIKAEEALQASGTNKDTLKSKYLKEVDMLRKKLTYYHDFFIKLPLRTQTRKDYEFGKLSLEESLNAFESGDVMKANKKMTAGKIRISQADKEVNALLKDYFVHFPKWQQWVRTTISQSAQNNSYAFVVDKIMHKGFLYYNGKVVKEYEVELGKNWIGDKEYAGDNKTPEGIYSVTKKKSPQNTKYYKALLINYPNSDDRAAYAAKVRSGAIPKSRGIGNLIELHGNGGKGNDWTNGCVALPDNKMDELFSKLPVGATVTIVGSTVSLAELLN